jgi:hypothetical protein
MSLRSSLSFVGVLLATLTSSCLGGQTGQPTSANCEKEPLGDAAWYGFTSEQLGRAFEGEHAAPLFWLQEPAGSATTQLVGLDDSLSLRLRYEGTSGVLDCNSRLEIPMALELSTSNSALSDGGSAVLVFTDAERPLRASISFVGSAVAVSGMMSESAAGEPPEGTLQPRTGDAPGAWASFPAAPPLNPDASVGGGGAGQ